ncbi:MAG: TonB family protein [Bacteroidia bacterium]|nr:TonB family protein [Bacteroidia bacterium]
MSERNKNGNDRLSDFLRYKGNKMTDRERNAFERNLQKDPFSEEASEGLEGIDPSVAEKDVAGLMKQLKRRTSRKQRVLWYSIAASVTVLMILSSIFIFTEKRKSSEQLSYAPVIQQSKDLQTLNDRPQTETKAPTAVPVEKKEEEISAKSRELIRVAVPAEPDQFSASEKAMPAKSVRAGKTSDTVMEFKPDSSAVNLNEVVVVGYGARGAGDEAEEAINEYTPPHPVKGRADFDKYIRENIRRPDTTTAGQRVVVVLNFNVNAKGKIDSIRIIRSPGRNFSNEAIRLIKEGPAWKPAEENGNAISDEVRIRIVFK